MSEPFFLSDVIQFRGLDFGGHHFLLSSCARDRRVFQALRAVVPDMNKDEIEWQLCTMVKVAYHHTTLAYLKPGLARGGFHDYLERLHSLLPWAAERLTYAVFVEWFCRLTEARVRAVQKQQQARIHLSRHGLLLHQNVQVAESSELARHLDEFLERAGSLWDPIEFEQFRACGGTSSAYDEVDGEEHFDDGRDGGEMPMTDMAVCLQQEMRVDSIMAGIQGMMATV